MITDRGDQRTTITLILDPLDFKLTTFPLPKHWELCSKWSHYVLSDRRTLITDQGDQRTAITLILDPSDFKLATFYFPYHWALCSK